MRARVAAAGQARNDGSSLPSSCFQVKIHGAAEAAGTGAVEGGEQVSEGDPSPEAGTTGTPALLLWLPF